MWVETLPASYNQSPEMFGPGEASFKPRYERLQNPVSISPGKLKGGKNTDFEEMLSKLS